MEKEKFEKARNTRLTDDEFLTLLILVPVFAIAHSDGEYDSQERSTMNVIIRNLVSSIYSELNEEESLEMTTAFEEDLEYVLIHPNTEKFLLECLRAKTKMIPGLSQQVQFLMKEVAESSNGISLKEQTRINEILHFIQ